MHYFAYPALFYKDEDLVRVIFPDLSISTEGANLTEAFLFAKDLLRVYFSYALKYELEYSLPSKVENLIPKCKRNEVAMLVDTFVGPNDIKKINN